MHKNRSITRFRSIADNQLRNQAINRRHYNNALAVCWKKKGFVSIIHFCAGEQTNEETEMGWGWRWICIKLIWLYLCTSQIPVSIHDKSSK